MRKPPTRKYTSESGFASILVVIIVLVIGAVGFVWLRNQNSQTQVSTPSSSTPTSISESEQVNTSDWKTYTNTEWGFTLKYPEKSNRCKNYKVVLEPNGHYVDIYCGKTGPNLSQISSKETNQNLLDWWFTLLPENESFLNEFGTAENSTFNDEKATKLTFQEGEINEKYSEVIFLVSKRNRNYQIVSYQQLCSSCWEAKIEKQILSTFEFLEKTEVSNWEKYITEEYEFEYPNYMSVFKFEGPTKGIQIRETDASGAIFWSISISILDNPNELDAESYVDARLNEKSTITSNREEKVSLIDLGLDKAIIRKTMFVDKIRSEKVIGLPSRAGAIEIFVPKGSRMYTITLDPYAPDTFPEIVSDSIKTLDQILSTFEFIE